MKIQTSSLNLYPPEEVVKRFVYNKWSLDKIEHLTSTTYHALHVFGEDEETRKNEEKNKYTIEIFWGCFTESHIHQLS